MRYLRYNKTIINLIVFGKNVIKVYAFGGGALRA